MRVLAESARGGRDAHFFEQRDSAVTRCRALDCAVPEQHLLELIADGVRRVERGHGLLEDHRDSVAAKIGAPSLAHDEEILAGEGHPARAHGRARGQEPH